MRFPTSISNSGPVHAAQSLPTHMLREVLRMMPSVDAAHGTRRWLPSCMLSSPRCRSTPRQEVSRLCLDGMKTTCKRIPAAIQRQCIFRTSPLSTLEPDQPFVISPTATLDSTKRTILFEYRFTARSTHLTEQTKQKLRAN